MEIKEIEIRNFGPYREASADFKSNGDSKLHIIEGPQGAGKTNFLKSLKWCLYGDSYKGGRATYREHYNETAMSEKEEEMYVKIKFKEGGHTYRLRREVDRFNHNSEIANHKATLSAPEERLTDQEKIEDKIEEIIPKQLNQFFFLDGEKIRELVGEESGKDVKEEIETALKHQAIINTQKDLEDFLGDLKEERNNLEEQKDERDNLKEEIKEKSQKKEQKIKERDQAKEDIQEKKETKEEIRERLEELEDEIVEEMNELDEKLTGLRSSKKDELEKLRKSWANLDNKIIENVAKEVEEEIEEEIEETESRIDEIRKHEYFHDLEEEMEATGDCPVCGQPADEIELETYDSADEKLDHYEDKKSRLRSMKKKLDIETDSDKPSKFIVELEDLNARINEKEERREEIKEQLGSNHGGKPISSEKEELQDHLNSVIDKKKELEKKKVRLKDRIEELKKEIDGLRNEKAKKSGDKDLEEIYQKIEIVNQAIDKIKEVRNQHVKQKRKKIKEEMNDVFEKVSRSEFMRKKYDGLAFKGAAGDDNSYVLQLVKSNGEKKKMEYHTPSAGETQITALSFIFGLNQYAKYSTTIVFDTVAGRLDLANSKGQGKFFAQLSEPLILLVTDAELENMGEELKNNIENHYKIKPDDNENSILKKQ